MKNSILPEFHQAMTNRWRRRPWTLGTRLGVELPPPCTPGCMFYCKILCNVAKTISYFYRFPPPCELRFPPSLLRPLKDFPGSCPLSPQRGLYSLVCLRHRKRLKCKSVIRSNTHCYYCSLLGGDQLTESNKMIIIARPTVRDRLRHKSLENSLKVAPNL